MSDGTCTGSCLGQISQIYCADWRNIYLSLMVWWSYSLSVSAGTSIPIEGNANDDKVSLLSPKLV